MCASSLWELSFSLIKLLGQHLSQDITRDLNRPYISKCKVLRHVSLCCHSHPVSSLCCHCVCLLLCHVSLMTMNNISCSLFGCHAADSNLVPGLVVRSGNGGGLVVAYLGWQREITQDGDDVVCHHCCPCPPFIVPTQTTHCCNITISTIHALMWRGGGGTRVVVVVPSPVCWVVIPCHYWVVVPCHCWAVIPHHHQLLYVHWWRPEVGCDTGLEGNAQRP